MLHCLKNKFVCVIFLFFIFFITGYFNVKAEGLFSKSTYSLSLGKDMLLAPSSKTRGNKRSWSSSNPSIASVDSYGIVHAIALGKTEITAVNNKSGKKSKCCVEVCEQEPVRITFTSSTMAVINAPFDVKAITPKNVELIRFEIRGQNYSQDIYCSNKSNEGNFYLWNQSIKFPCAGTYSINTYAKIKNEWKTCGEASTDVLIMNEYKKTEPSLTEKRISPEGADFVAYCEGFCSSVYKDLANVLTIGYGQRIHPYEPFYNNISETEAMAVFLKILNQGGYTKNVNQFLINNKIKFNQQQFDALLSFSYNLGWRWIISGSDLSGILLKAGQDATNSWRGIVNSDDGLFVRSSPSTTGKKLEVLSNKAVVEILSPNKENNSWYKVKSSSGAVGYCFGDYLKVELVIAAKNGDLGCINKGEFIKEFSLYHHANKKCYKGLLVRRFRELDIFLRGIYSKFSCGNYPIPECAKK